MCLRRVSEARPDIYCCTVQVMGNVWSEAIQPLPTPPARLVTGPSKEASPPSNRRKRALSDEDIEELSPKRKRIQSTSNYIYRTLFQDGANSDITIHALGMYFMYTYTVYSIKQCIPLNSVFLQGKNGIFTKFIFVRCV